MEDYKYDVFKDDEKIGCIDCRMLANIIDDTVVHNTAFKPHSKHTYRVVKRSQGDNNEN